LTKEGLPIIRYRTRDLTRLLPGTARSMRRMEKITGRSDDMIILRGVNVFPTQIEEQLLKVPALAPHFQIVLSRDGRMDNMAITVEAVEGHTDDAARAAAAKALAHHIKSVVGVSAKVDVGLPGSAPRSEGKARRVVDDRPKV
ncbi:MAG: phenylacetate--CoA ligase, partial [Rhodobacteraceae bacterium]|nr:phenylacetate--CoA ligase [Paracoccaceae bacterium]